MKIKAQAEAFKRAYPLISPKLAKYMHKKPEDVRKRGRHIKMWILMWADDGRVGLHPTMFSKAKPMQTQEWSDWIKVHAPEIITENVLPYINRTFGSSWNIERVFGWHFARKQRPE